MSLQYLWTLFTAHPAQTLNTLALFFAVAGGWLLMATRLREQRALARLAGGMNELDEESLEDEPTRRINQFFYVFAAATLLVALMLSWYSTSL